MNDPEFHAWVERKRHQMMIRAMAPDILFGVWLVVLVLIVAAIL